MATHDSAELARLNNLKAANKAKRRTQGRARRKPSIKGRIAEYTLNLSRSGTRPAGHLAHTEQGRALVLDVMVLEERQAYGRHEYLVTPVEGTGSVWVRADSVKLLD